MTKEEIATELAYEVLEHDIDVIADHDTLSEIILKKLTEILHKDKGTLTKGTIVE